MKKIFTLVICLILSLGLLTGCINEVSTISIDSEGNGNIAVEMKIEKAKCDKILSEYGFTEGEIKPFLDSAFGDGNSKFIEKTIGTKTYYYTSTEEKFTGHSELQTILESKGYEDVYVLRNSSGIRFVSYSDESIRALLSDDEANDLINSTSEKISITMPENIIKCSDNGVINVKKPNTVDFEIKGEMLEKSTEFMVSTAAEETLPRIIGAKPGATYKNPITVIVKDESGIKSAKYSKDGATAKSFDFQKYITRNGKYVITATDYYGNVNEVSFTYKDLVKPTVEGVANRTIDNPYKSTRYIDIEDNTALKSVKLTKNGKTTSKSTNDGEYCAFTLSSTGKYKIVATDVNGNVRTKSFIIDKVKPTVSGVKNKAKYTKAVTVKYKDNYKVKSATINGKSFKSGKKVSKKGTYKVVVKDTAGNTKTVTFTIK